MAKENAEKKSDESLDEKSFEDAAKPAAKAIKRVADPSVKPAPDRTAPAGLYDVVHGHVVVKGDDGKRTECHPGSVIQLSGSDAGRLLRAKIVRPHLADG